MQVQPEDISIAVTVFNRLEYLEEALDSAVNQTVPVRVLLYDDGCRDEGGLQRILASFGNRVEHRRNPRTLGLFQNMNHCIWSSPTPWVSILHDDDALAKDFVERIVDVSSEAGDCTLFCGGTLYMDANSRIFHRLGPPLGTRWRRITADEFAWKNWFPFPGQLMHVATAREAGGFPRKSTYTGDWELWFRLAQRGGVVQLGADLARHRAHLGDNRGTTTASKTGRRVAYCAMQTKRNLAQLRGQSPALHFDRQKWLYFCGPLYRDLLVYAWNMPSWLLRYNRQLLLLTKQEGRISRTLQWVSRLLGNPGIRFASLLRMLGERLGIKMPQTF